MADNEKPEAVSETQKMLKGDELRFKAIRDAVPLHLRPQNVPKPLINLSTTLNERFDHILRKVEKKEVSEPMAAEIFAEELRRFLGKGVASFVRQTFIRVSGDSAYAYIVGPNDFSTSDSDETEATKLLLFVLSNAAGGNRALGVYRSCNVKLHPLTPDETHYSRLPEEMKREYDNRPIPCTALVYDGFDDEKRRQVQQATIVLPVNETQELAKSSKTELIRNIQPSSLHPPLPSLPTPSVASGSEEGHQQAEPDGEVNPERPVEIRATSSQSIRNDITTMAGSASSQARPGQERPELPTVTPGNGVRSLCDERLATEDTTTASLSPKKIVQEKQKTASRSSHDEKGKARAVDHEDEDEDEELNSIQRVRKSRRSSKNMEWPSRRAVREEGPGDESSDVTDHSVEDGEEDREESGDEEKVNPTITDNGPVTPGPREKRKRKLTPSSGESEKRSSKHSRLVPGAVQSSPSSSRRPTRRHQSSNGPTAQGQIQLDAQKAIERRKSEPSLRHQQHGGQSDYGSTARHSQAAEAFGHTESDHTTHTFTQSSRAMSANHLPSISTIRYSGANVQYELAQGSSVPSRGAEGRRAVDFMFGPSVCTALFEISGSARAEVDCPPFSTLKVPMTSENFADPQCYPLPQDTIVGRPREITVPRPQSVELRARQPGSSTGTSLSRDATGLLQGWHAILMNIDEAILAEAGIRVTPARIPTGSGTQSSNNEVSVTPRILPSNPEDSLRSLLNDSNANKSAIRGSGARDRSPRDGQDQQNRDTRSRVTQQGQVNTQTSQPPSSSRSTMREALGNQQQVLENRNGARSRGQHTTNQELPSAVNSAFDKKERSPMDWALFSEEELVDDRGSPIDVDLEVTAPGASGQSEINQHGATSQQASSHQISSGKSMKLEEDLGRTKSNRDNARAAGSTSQLLLSSNNVAANRGGGSSQPGSSKGQAPAQGGEIKSKPPKPGKALLSSAPENVPSSTQKGRGDPSSGSGIGALPSKSGDRKGKEAESPEIPKEEAAMAGDPSETPQVVRGGQDFAPRSRSASKTSPRGLRADSQSSVIEATNIADSRTTKALQEKASEDPVSNAGRMTGRPGDEEFFNTTQALHGLSIKQTDKMDTSEN
ncbi:hypothetical protein FS837_009292 [Tulasnella sp. UAMH 9824]|nr:hypothetical protein FS837_009292 [Tulasnella sp. UAMH 9824]